MNIYDFNSISIDGSTLPLARYQGNLLLIVNTASNCGFTPQYKGLEALYLEFKDHGLVVLGFPCNQFGAQEPGSASDIAQFCETNYRVSFPMFSKVEVNGPGADPLFKFLKREQGGFFGPIGFSAIKWNFTKFLVNREGKVIGRYAPTCTPAELSRIIRKLL